MPLRGPQLTTPASFFSAFITNSPSVPAPAAMKAIAKACPILNGVIQYISAPSSAAVSAPVNQARAENWRSMRRASGRRRSHCDTPACTSCAQTATITRKNTRKAPRCS